MSRALVLSNGSLSVAIDTHGMVRDLYYPHVGHENHTRGHYLHRVGVWADGRLSWLSSGEWQIDVRLEDNALISAITAKHQGLGVELRFTDLVCDEKTIFLRRVRITNVLDYSREIKLYFGQEFEIQKMHGSDTAYYDPRTHSIIHYKGRRVFSIGAELEGEGFNDFATGRTNFQGKEGSHRDADDGELSKNPIEHGPADSVIGLYALYAAKQERTCDYWIIAAQSVHEAEVTHSFLKHKTPAKIIASTVTHWQEWLRPLQRDFADLTPEQAQLYRASLMYARAHADVDGGILASVDSDMFQYGLDTYSYVWMRDSAYIVHALERAGETRLATHFFEFCKNTITKDGYFMHKYLPDGALGSSWHPWIKDGRTQLPIQEDETAIVLYALDAHIERTNDNDLLKQLYEPLVEKAAQFLISYRDDKLKLPLPSYDLWERKRGTSTYTSASVCGALKAAARMANRMKKEKEAAHYEKAAREVHEGILTHLWRADIGMFCNMMNAELGPPVYDPTIDISSVYGIFLFDILPPKEMRLIRAFEGSVRRLSEGIAIGGIARFENDDYYHVPGPATGNPWFLTTLWYAEYLIATANSHDDLRKVKDIFAWVVKYAQPSQVLSEQLDPATGTQVSAGPLAWTHAAYILAVIKYCEKYDELGAK